MKVGLVYGPMLLRQALSRLLVTENLDVQWDAADVAEAYARAPVDLLVTELTLPDGSALDLIRDLRGANPQLLALLLIHRAEELRCADLEACCTAYLPIWSGTQDVIQALSSLRGGRSYVHSELALTLLKGPGRVLTPGEYRVLELVSDGLSAEEAARVLQVSVNTTKTHLRGVYRKLNVRGQTQAVVEAFRLGLVAPPEKTRLRQQR